MVEFVSLITRKMAAATKRSLYRSKTATNIYLHFRDLIRRHPHRDATMLDLLDVRLDRSRPSKDLPRRASQQNVSAFCCHPADESIADSAKSRVIFSDYREQSGRQHISCFAE